MKNSAKNSPLKRVVTNNPPASVNFSCHNCGAILAVMPDTNNYLVLNITDNVESCALVRCIKDDNNNKFLVSSLKCSCGNKEEIAQLAKDFDNPFVCINYVPTVS